jgi:A/G-specific adenine glycosylase
VNEARFRRAVLGWHRRHPRSFPWRESRDPYALLVGEVLLQRTRGENVVPVFETFVERWPSPSALARARTSSIASVIRPLGLAKRAPILKDLGKALVDRGGVPDMPEELLSLPGVGPYAAHAVPTFAQGQNLPVVDWVIARVLRRYFGLPDNRRPSADPDLWGLASRLARNGRARELWLGTLDFAAAVCKPRPLCPVCPLRDTCAYYAAVGAPG